MVLYIAIVKDNFKSIIYIYNYSLCDNYHNEIKLNTFIYIYIRYSAAMYMFV